MVVMTLWILRLGFEMLRCTLLRILMSIWVVRVVALVMFMNLLMVARFLVRRRLRVSRIIWRILTLKRVSCWRDWAVLVSRVRAVFRVISSIVAGAVEVLLVLLVLHHLRTMTMMAVFHFLIGPLTHGQRLPLVVRL